MQTETNVGCARQCLHYVQSGDGECNSYSHDLQSLQCQLASLTFLEEEIYPGWALIGPDPSTLCSDWFDHDVADH